jgi:hypothetical protein
MKGNFLQQPRYHQIRYSSLRDSIIATIMTAGDPFLRVYMYKYRLAQTQRDARTLKPFSDSFQLDGALLLLLLLLFVSPVIIKALEGNTPCADSSSPCVCVCV